MPVEIKELIVRATVTEASKTNEKSERNAAPVDIEFVVAECVEQVLDILKEKEER